MSKYFLIAGEASGDTHAARLINELRRSDPEAHFAGLGGDRMAAAGCRLYQDYRHMAFMAFAAVISHLGQIHRNFQIARKALLTEQPDALILIDYPSFNLRMAAYSRKHLPKTKIYYYIPPKVWAWKRRRIHTIARLCDGVLGIFPFEPDFYARYGYHCTYVGNPTVEEIMAKGEWAKGGSKGKTVSQSGGRSVIALLPGSRENEVRHCLPVMLEAARRMNGYAITVTAAPGLEGSLYTPYLRDGETLTRETYAALQNARMAVVNSGTATLETALLNCPQVAVYHLACSRLLGLIRWAQPLLFSIRHFTLVNILAGREVIRELVANDFTADKIETELRRLTDEDICQQMQRDYAEIRTLLGTQSAPQSAAQIISTSRHDDMTT